MLVLGYLTAVVIALLLLMFVMNWEPGREGMGTKGKVVHLDIQLCTLCGKDGP